MKKKHNQCYLLLGTAIMLLLSCLCSFVFVKGNLEQAARKSSFESMYENTSIDYIVPGPSSSQVEELENSIEKGISVVTPYYETNTTIVINGTSINSTSIIFSYAEKMEYTPYSSARIINGRSSNSADEAIADQLFADKYDCKVGDKVNVDIAGHTYEFEVQGIAETNTYYSGGTIALILSAEEAKQFETEDIRYSAAYISASDISACETYLYSEYKPMSRLKNRSEFDSEETYNQHLQNFNEADWSKEITNCQKNYQTLSVKYENVESGIWTNIAIMSIIVAVVIIVFNTVLLTKSSMKSFMKAFLVKKSGTKESVKSFYKSGIKANVIVFCLASIGIYYYLASQTNTRLIDLQLLNCIIPILFSIVISFIMIGIAGSYVERHYKIKVIKKKDSTEEVQVEVI